ncbi:MAG: hypothetical protein M0Q26_02405 [Chitinophagaceae bacterium]|nr:hypothetical protein [Chitinophagaceae bacterium]
MILGFIMMIYTGFNFVTIEKVVAIRHIQINQKKNNPVKWSPVVGVILLIGGITMTIFSKKTKTEKNEN